MTADQVSKGMPNDLQSSETCAIQLPLAAEPSVHEEAGHAPDQEAQTPPNFSATVQIPNLDNITEIQATDIRDERGSGNDLDLVLVQPQVQTLSMATNRFNTGEEADVNIGNHDPEDISQVRKDEGIYTQTGQGVSKEEHIIPRSQPTTNLCRDVSDSTIGTKGIVEPVAPENVTSQDLIVDDCMFIGISMKSTVLPMLPEHQDDSAETVKQNFDQNCLALSNQETKVLANSQDGENKISNNEDSTQTDDQSPSGHSSRKPSTVGNMPDPDFETDCEGKTLQDVMTGADRVGQGETVCNTDPESSDVIHTDPEISGIVGETVCNANPKISDMVQETVYDFQSVSTKGPSFNPDPEVGDTVTEMLSCSSSGIPDIIHVSTGSIVTLAAKGISCETVNTAMETKDNTDSEISICDVNSKVDDIMGEIYSETLCNTGPGIGYMCGETTCSLESNTSGILSKTACSSDSVAESVPNSDAGIFDLIGEPMLNFDSVVCKTTEHHLSVDRSCTYNVNPVCEIPAIQETLYKLAVELNKPDTVCDPLVPTQTSMQSSSKELNDNNLDSRTSTLDQAIPNPNVKPADTPADSTASLLENILTQTTQTLFTESELDIVTAEPCVQEDPVPDRIPALMLHQLESSVFHGNDPVMDKMTKMNSDTYLQIPCVLDSSTETPQISEEAGTDPPATVQDVGSSCRGTENCLAVTESSASKDLSDELWMDACQFLTNEEDRESIFDEWGHSPAPSPPRSSLTNTKSLSYSQGKEAVIGQLRDWDLPPVERWSSSDSWASALSDWFQSVSVFTEDCPLAATTKSSSNPLETQPEPCMAVQDTIEEQKDSQGSPSAAGQMRLPPSPTEVGVGAQSGRVPRDDNFKETLLQLNMHLHAQSYSAGTQDSPEVSVDTQKERETETVDPSGAYMPNLGSHLQETTVAPAMPKKECTAGKLAGQHSSGSKLDSDEVRKVKEDRTFQLSIDFKEENIRKYSPSKFSGYSSDKDPRAGHACGSHLDTRDPQLDRRVPLQPEYLTQSEGVETVLHTPHAEGSWSHEGYFTRDSGATQRPSRSEEFIMPFAPISIGTSFHRSCEDQTSSKTSLKPSLIGINDEVRVDRIGCLPAKVVGKPSSGEEPSDDQSGTTSSACEDSEELSSQETSNTTEIQKASDISRELSKLILLTGQRFIVSEEKRVAYVTLDLDDALNFNKGSSDVKCDQRVPSFQKQHNCEEQLHTEDAGMPHKTLKMSSEGKSRARHKEKVTGQQLGTPTKKQPEARVENESLVSETGTVTVIETIVITEKITPKPQGKKKKKHGTAKPESEPLASVENGARPKATKATGEGAEAKLNAKPGKVKEKPALPIISTVSTVSTDSPPKTSAIKCKETEAIKANTASCGQEPQSTSLTTVPNDDVIKRRRICGEKTETAPVRTRPQLPAIFRQKKEEDVAFKRAYSDVVKQKIQKPKEVVAVPRVVAEIQAAPVPDDPQSISLWCQFSPVAADTSITWTKEGKVLSEQKRGVNDESRVTLSIVKACSKDLGMYCCSLTSSLGSASTADYHLTSEVLMELVIPSHDTPVDRKEVDGEEEDVHCASLLFKEDILTDQYFGEKQPASIVTEKAHFGEGMHRKAFRTTLRAGMVPVFYPGHPCVLKVHNAIGYGTKNNEELVEKNYNLAVEECHVQNTAREYIKAYMNAAKSAESFGEVPEIIPIYLVHRPSNDIPYATLEEELIGDFVKYSVKDGKEINLMRRDSEAGQKSCAFQHWVYAQTDGNLLVTDMQGVGMKLTDVGIATCRKGYKGFKGNCATSFIDQFKALHQCNRFCELLGLPSLQPKRTVAPPKPKSQPAPKKKTFGPVLKGK